MSWPLRNGGNLAASNIPFGNISGSSGNLLAQTTSTNTGGSTKCFGGAMSSFGDYNAVQLIFINSGASPATIDNHCVGASATAYPSGAFNICVPTSGWSAPAGSIVVPAGTSKQPGIALGPKISLRSIPRAAGEGDNGTLPLCFFRMTGLAGNATMPYFDLGAAFEPAYDSVNEGFSILTTPLIFSDAVTTPSAWTSGSRETQPVLALAGMVFTYDQKRVSICPVGDSVTCGGTTTAVDRAPYSFKAIARINATGVPVSYLNGGISGSTIVNIAAHAKNIISTLAPDIITLPSYTINSDVTTQSAWDAQWFNVMDAAQSQLSAGRKVLIETPRPNNSFTTSQNSFRQIQRSRVINSGLPYVDYEPLIDSNGHFLVAADTVDGTHLTSLGNEHLCSLLLPSLAAIA